MQRRSLWAEGARAAAAAPRGMACGFPRLLSSPTMVALMPARVLFSPMD